MKIKKYSTEIFIAFVCVLGCAGLYSFTFGVELIITNGLPKSLGSISIYNTQTLYGGR